MDALRKQLDELMGVGRNGDGTEVKRKYSDSDICRFFLAGLCPHDLFSLTKLNLGPCPRLHSLSLRKEYLAEIIEKLIHECDMKIQRSLKRLHDKDSKAAISVSVSEVTQAPEVMELSKQIKEKLKEVDIYELEGKTDEKIRALEVLEELRIKRTEKQSILLFHAFNKDRAPLPLSHQHTHSAPIPYIAPPDCGNQEIIPEKLKKAEDLREKGLLDEAQKLLYEVEDLKKKDQRLRICDICGAFLSVYDSANRIAEHFGGKLHLGYIQIREKLAEIKEERRKNQKRCRYEDYFWRSKERGHDHEQPRIRGSQERENDYDHYTRDCVQVHGREWDRDFEYYHGHARELDRDFNKYRNYDSESYGRDCDRGHDRELDRDFNKNHNYDSGSRRSRDCDRAHDRELDKNFTKYCNYDSRTHGRHCGHANDRELDKNFTRYHNYDSGSHGRDCGRAHNRELDGDFNRYHNYYSGSYGRDCNSAYDRELDRGFNWYRNYDSRIHGINCGRAHNKEVDRGFNKHRNYDSESCSRDYNFAHDNYWRR